MRKRKHFYQVILVIEDRDDVDDNWKKTKKVVYETNNYEKAMEYIYIHRFMETNINPNDNGEHWLHIQRFYINKLR